jgi:4-amino-4-deoxy-L-arabinose transferase-like glycosyltransferase
MVAVLTILLCYLFAAKVLKRPLAGLFTGLLLVTFSGYIDFHVSRTGDYDALISLLKMAYLLFFFLFVHSEDNRKENRYLVLFSMTILVAFFTKSIAGLFFLPGIVLYSLCQTTI